MAFSDDLKKYVDIAVDKTRDAFGKGKKAVSKFGDDSATRIEKLHYEKRRARKLRRWACSCSRHFQRKRKSLSP